MSNSVKQGCVLAQILFSIIFLAILSDFFRECQKIIDTIIRDFLLTDDGQEMLLEIGIFSAACDNFGITININVQTLDPSCIRSRERQE